MTTTQDLEDLTIYALANMANVALPDREYSAGGRLLDNVRSEVLEAHEFEPFTDVDHDRVHELADNAPSCYTSARWAEFTDLAAYREDVREYLDTLPEDLDQVAGIALYVIAERLAVALIEELTEEN